jgi:LysM repeat protein
MFASFRKRPQWLVLSLMVLLLLLWVLPTLAQDQDTDEVELTGVLEQIGDGFIVVSGQTISIVGAEINDPLVVGGAVKVHFSTINGQAVAREVESADDVQPGCTPTRPEGWVTYVIQPGNTLSGIAARTGSSVQELARVNCIANPRRITPGMEIFVPLPIEDDSLIERCRLNEIEPERCRALLFGDDDAIAERCRLNEIEPERCRELFSGDDANPAERCELAGIEPERCRALLFGDDNNLAERCRLNEIEPERCRNLLFGDDDAFDDSSGPGSDNSGSGEGRGGDDDTNNHDANDDHGQDEGEHDSNDIDGQHHGGDDDRGGDDNGDDHGGRGEG